MKILIVNKFLYQKGGSETYIFKLGDVLKENGHKVEYFGLQNDKNIVGNNLELYVSDMDFSKGVLKNLGAPFRIIYSLEARRKIRKVLNDFMPDVVHLNNIQFHLTPSIILEIQKYRKSTGRSVKIVYTAHDYQLVCPSHGFFNSNSYTCEKCLGGNYTNCLKTKCVKNSRAKSLLAMADAYFWKWSKAYSYIDTIICPSQFLKSKLDTQDRFSQKTVAIHNFMEKPVLEDFEKEDYVLEFGNLSEEKGTDTVITVAKRMPDVKFLFAGYGKSVDEIKKLENAEYLGFKTGRELSELIQKARLSIYPSKWYENCPFSVIESQMYSTPVIGSKVGGIPELISDQKTGLLFECGNADDLEAKLRMLIYDDKKLNEMTENCKKMDFETPNSYYQKLIGIYEGNL